MMADVLHRLGELLHVGEDFLLGHEVGARLLARGVDVVDTEVGENELHLTAGEQSLRTGLSNNTSEI